MKKENFIILTHERSGSNALVRILNQHPKLNVMVEPFNEDRIKWKKGNKNYKQEISSLEDIDPVLSEIHETHNGFKTLMYQLPQEYYEYILDKEDKIILLHRKNLLQATVSAEIAKQTGVWDFTKDSGAKKDTKKILSDMKEKKFKPLDMGHIRKAVEFLSNSTLHYKNLLRKSNKSFLDILYEDLFSPLPQKRRGMIEKIFDFLDVEIPSNNMQKIESIVSPDRKMNNKKTYELFVNTYEIEAELGGEKYGHLF
ncbi:MAG: hypothetical protein R3346_04315 [Candidatus Spechtbacterales bacterium]|nr:hypothetical protein [Candidatus Spechtbacterales bacterium]